MVFRAVSPGGQAKKTKLQELLTGLEAQADTCWLPRAMPLHKFFQGDLGFCRTPICSRWLAGPIQGSSLLLLGFLGILSTSATRRQQAASSRDDPAHVRRARASKICGESCAAGAQREAKQDVAKSEKAFEAEHFESLPGCSLDVVEDIRKDYERLNPGSFRTEEHRSESFVSPRMGKREKDVVGRACERQKKSHSIDKFGT